MPFWTERREVKNFLPSDVILTTARRKNPLQCVEALTTQCHSERLCLEESPTKRAFCMRSLTFVRDDIEIPCRAIAPGNAVILNVAQAK